MTRLPKPGLDEGVWGEILNDFLQQAHNNDGTLRDNIVTAEALAPGAVQDSALADSSITEAKLDASIRTKLNSPSVSSTDASATTKGIIQLAGDLSGNAIAPTVPGLLGKADISHTHAITEVTSLQTALDGKATLSHTHSLNDTTGLQASLDAKADKTTTYTKAEVDAALDAKPDATITYTKTEIDTALSTKAASSHSHTISDTTGLQTAMDSKADQAAVVSGLASKASVSHSHAISDTTGLQAAIDNKANQATTYTKSEVDNVIASMPSSTHTHKQILPYSQAGTLQTTTGTFRLYNDTDATWTIMGIRASVGMAPTGTSVIIDVNVNANTIFTTQSNRPSIVAGTTTSGLVSSMDITNVAVGEYLTVDIDQTGDPFAGTDLCVQIIVK